MIDNHPAGSRITIKADGIVQTLTNRMGTGGGNVPLAMQAFGICSDGSNSMCSNNPHSGIYEADTSRTLDANGGNPACNQGGIAVVALQGSMIGRADSNGPQGTGINENISFTLNTIDRHAVLASGKPATGTLMANCATKQWLGNQEAFSGDYSIIDDMCVRRLTPRECAMLQGFPADWCSELGTPEPTDEEIDWWFEVFETHRKIMGTSSKPKSRNQIIKWLQTPNSDSAEYKMWGNGVALPCVCYVLAGIVEAVNLPSAQE